MNETGAFAARFAAARFLLAALALRRALKANFDPKQPRAPRGNPDGGRWTTVGGEGTWGGAPKVPEQRPPTAPLRNAIIKTVARWLRVTPLGRLGTLVELGSWLYEYGGYIAAYLDAPKTLQELRRAVGDPKTGYDIHHIVEQTPARRDGFPESLIEAPENLVRIPTLKHWEITAWYNAKNDDYGGLSPRAYLRGKTWEERVKVGYVALVRHGVLLP